MGWSDDAAGNLLSDGTTTYGYDALNRLVTQDGTTNNLQRRRCTGAARHDAIRPGSRCPTQPGAQRPCDRLRAGGADTYVYGHERLTALGQAWYVGDALGNVRATLDDTGAVQATANYAPFGEPQGSSIAPFGFTGEFQDQGLVNLRARWYDPSIGTFTAVDPFAGFPEMPYSLHPYQYVYSAPTTWTDPSGEIVWVVVGVVAVGAVILTIGVVNDTTAIQSNPRAFDAAGFEIVPWEEAIPNTIDRVRTDAPKGATLVYNSCAEAVDRLFTLSSGHTDSESDDADGEASEDSSESSTGPYSHLQDPPGVGSGKNFTPAQKERIIRENKQRNNGEVRSDISGEKLVKPSKSRRGVTPPQNEWQIDHSKPRDKGGTNSYSNAQVLSRQENRNKSNQ